MLNPSRVSIETIFSQIFTDQRVDRTELYRVTGLFLLAMITLTSDLSSLTGLASIFGTIAFLFSYAVMILAPSYIVADLVMELAER